MCLEALEVGFSWEKLGRGLLETYIVSSKAVPKDSKMKFRSKFNNGFTYRGYWHCATLKA